MKCDYAEIVSVLTSCQDSRKAKAVLIIRNHADKSQIFGKVFPFPSLIMHAMKIYNMNN